MGLGELLFFSVWLLGWTAGVCFIQHGVLSEGLGSGLTLFLFTHGGAEVVVLWALASRIRSQAEEQREEPVLDRDHAGMRARWRPGNQSLAVMGLGGVLGLVVHAALLGVPISLFPSLSLGLASVALGLCVLWLGTGVHFASALRAHTQAREVRLDADIDRVQIEQTGGPPVVLPMLGLKAEATGDDLHLSSNGTHWRSGCKQGAARDELVEALNAMAQRATPAVRVEEPASLRRMREGEPPVTG